MREAKRGETAGPAHFEGIGLHTGGRTKIAVRPAAPGSGISFRRVDLPGTPAIPAIWDKVGSLALCTALTNGEATVSTVEHLMATLSALGVDDVLVEVDGPEIPILDGSALPFVRGLVESGMTRASERRWVIRILRTIEIRDGDRMARLEPGPCFAVDCTIDFSHPVIGRSTYVAEMSREVFMHQVAPARTFALEAEVERMRAAGLALGGSLDNAVVVGAFGVLNPGGLRFQNEFARHKALDAMGDLRLAGAPIVGRYVSERSGHAMNNALLRQLMASPGHWRHEEVEAPADAASGSLAAA